MNEWKIRLMGHVFFNNLPSLRFQPTQAFLDQLDPYFEPQDFQCMYEGWFKYEDASGELKRLDFWIACLPYSSKPLADYQHLFTDASMNENRVLPKYGRKLVMVHAILSGNTQVMQLLFSRPYRMDPHKIHNQGTSRLHVAASEQGHINSLRFLMSPPYNLKLNVQSINYETVLHVAAQNQKEDTFSFLLRHYPAQAKACWWMGEINHKTPLMILKIWQAEVEGRDLDPLQTCFNEYTQLLLNNEPLSEEKSELLEVFAEEWKEWLFSKGAAINSELLGNKAELFLSSRPKLAKAMRDFQQIRALIDCNTVDQILNYELLQRLLNLTQAVEDQSGRALSFIMSLHRPSVNNAMNNLKKCLHKSTPGEAELNIEVLRAIHVIISDAEKYERRYSSHWDQNSNQKLSKAFFALREKLLKTRSISTLRAAHPAFIIRTKVSNLPVATFVSNIVDEAEVFVEAPQASNEEAVIVSAIHLSFETLIDSILAEYVGYCKIVDDETDVSIQRVELASNFIMQRYCRNRCEINADFAPEGEVRRDGVERYLEAKGFIRTAKVSECTSCTLS